MVVMVWDTMVDMAMDMVMDIAWAMPDMDMVLDMDMAMDSDTTARGLLTPSPRPRLMPLLTLTTMEDMVWAMPDMVMDMAMVIMAVDTVMDTVMVMAMATTDKSSQPYLLQAQHQKGELAIHQDLSVNHQLLCQHQMDYFSLSFIPHLCCQFQCCQPSPTRNGKQEAIE